MMVQGTRVTSFVTDILRYMATGRLETINGGIATEVATTCRF